jgi:hypothetical protein
METSNPILWLAWAAFGSFLAALLWKRYLPAVMLSPPAPREAPAAPRAWLFCEDGTALDRRVQWFDLRQGGRTVVGARPRSATADTSFVYLTADDIREDHVVVDFDPETGRYRAEAVGGAVVQHNNEPLPAGEKAELADGDTLDLGLVSRFRFTLTGPEAS